MRGYNAPLASRSFRDYRILDSLLPNTVPRAEGEGLKSRAVVGGVRGVGERVLSPAFGDEGGGVVEVEGRLKGGECVHADRRLPSRLVCNERGLGGPG